MLQFNKLKGHAGILLGGGYDDLRALHDVLHKVNEGSPIIRNKEGAFLGLAYDVRKAYERQREVFEAPAHSPEVGIKFGVKVLWPAILIQSRMLRASMAYMPTDRSMQAIAYSLEAVIESAIEADFAADAERIKQLWLAIDPAHPWPEEKFNSRSAHYASLTPTQRKRYIAGLLQSLNAMYPMLYKMMSEDDRSNCVDPAELDAWDSESGWPDPKW